MDSQTECQTSNADPVRNLRSDAEILRLAVTRTARRLRQEAGGGLSPTLISALASIERHGVMTPGQLASVEGVQRPTITKVVAKLAEAGLIERNPDPEDRRSVRLSVSEEGSRYLADSRSRKSAWLANLLNELPAEEELILVRAAEILGSALELHNSGEIRLSGDS